jgi:hypothetical protein
MRFTGRSLSIYKTFCFSIIVMAILGIIGAGGISMIGSSGRIGFEGVNLNRQAFAYGIVVLSLLWVMLQPSFWSARRLLLISGTSVLVLLLVLLILGTGSRGALLSLLFGMFVLLVGEAQP